MTGIWCSIIKQVCNFIQMGAIRVLGAYDLQFKSMDHPCLSATSMCFDTRRICLHLCKNGGKFHILFRPLMKKFLFIMWGLSETQMRSPFITTYTLQFMYIMIMNLLLEVIQECVLTVSPIIIAWIWRMVLGEVVK